jgi:hypothetical protein
MPRCSYDAKRAATAVTVLNQCCAYLQPVFLRLARFCGHLATSLFPVMPLRKICVYCMAHTYETVQSCHDLTKIKIGIITHVTKMWYIQVP